jgi:hypothetical protein
LAQLQSEILGTRVTLEQFGLRKSPVQWYLANQAWVEGVTSGAYRQWVGKQYGELIPYFLHINSEIYGLIIRIMS